MHRRPKAKLPPAFITPMQPLLVADLPNGREWLYEIKWDGWRAVAIKSGGDVRVWSRNHKDLTEAFPSVTEAVASISAETAVLDGEIVAIGADGRPSFSALQRRGSDPASTFLYAFDLLHLDGVDLRTTPLLERKARLTKILARSAVRASPALPGAPDAIAAELRKHGLEGIVAKKRASRYISGDSSEWVKLRLSKGQEFVVGGYVPPVNSIGALILGVYEGKRLMCCGRVRAGFNPLYRRELAPLLSKLTVDRCPFANLPMKSKGRFGGGISAEDMEAMRWVRPKVVVQVAFVEWTANGVLRHPKYLGIRTDKAADAVRRE